jgi:hypothetical protein
MALTVANRLHHIEVYDPTLDTFNNRKVKRSQRTASNTSFSSCFQVLYESSNCQQPGQVSTLYSPPTPTGQLTAAAAKDQV